MTILVRKRILFSLYNRFLLVKFGKQFPIEVEKFTIRLGGHEFTIFLRILMNNVVFSVLNVKLTVVTK